MQVHILKFMKKVPGGMMIVPLIVGAILNTLFPTYLNIGGFTTALFKHGAVPLISLFLLCMGSQIKVKEAGRPIAKGFVSLLSKFFVGLILSVIVSHFFGMKGIIGLSPLVIMSAFACANTGLYVSVADEYGDNDDIAAGTIIALSGGAFFTMIALGTSGLAKFPFWSMLSVILPVIIGFILGNIDEDMRKFLGSGKHVLIPFSAFALGSGMNFKVVLESGLPGVVLGIAVVFITGFVNYFIHGVIWEKKAVNFAVGTTAGNQLATPLAVAVVDKSLLPIVGVATTQIAASVIITAILCPVMVGFIDKRLKRKNGIVDNK